MSRNRAEVIWRKLATSAAVRATRATQARHVQTARQNIVACVDASPHLYRGNPARLLRKEVVEPRATCAPTPFALAPRPVPTLLQTGSVRKTAEIWTCPVRASQKCPVVSAGEARVSTGQMECQASWIRQPVHRAGQWAQGATRISSLHGLCSLFQRGMRPPAVKEEGEAFALSISGPTGMTEPALVPAQACRAETGTVRKKSAVQRLQALPLRIPGTCIFATETTAPARAYSCAEAETSMTGRVCADSNGSFSRSRACRSSDDGCAFSWNGSE
jgi:hypothetical protein